MPIDKLFAAFVKIVNGLLDTISDILSNVESNFPTPLANEIANPPKIIVPHEF